MSKLADYAAKYRNVRLERRDGILQVTLHTDGGPLTWGALKGSVHDQLGDAFYNIGHDRETRVVILTGTGPVFLTELNFSELPQALPRGEDWYEITREGKDLLNNLLDIEVPVIGVANGPAHIHAELLALSDILLAAEHASFADAVHFPNGMVPGDGAHVVWPLLLGPNRGRYFLYTGEVISAAEAKQLGFVAEVLPATRVLERAWELARVLSAKPILTLRYTRIALTAPLKRALAQDLGYGLALEGHGT
jgi:enoyl-CoA hydratase/carnithine racemase